MRVKNNIRAYREKKGITMKKLSELLDIHYQRLSMLERGEFTTIRDLNIERLCAILDATSEELFEVVT